MANFKMIPLKKLKNMEKGDAYNCVIRELDDLTEHYFRNAMVKKEEMNAIYERMKSKKHYARYIKHACKVEESNPFPDGFSFILADFLQKFGNEGVENEELGEVCEIYGNALDKINKKRAKKMAKDLDIPKDAAIELAIIYPGKILSKHNAWIFNRELQYRLGRLQKLCCPVEKEGDKKEAEDKSQVEFTKFDFADRKLIKKIYEGFFGDDPEILERVYANLMLDKMSVRDHFNESQKRLWDETTEWLIKAIEKQPIKVVKRIINLYTTRRNRDAAHKENDPHRRILLSELEYEKAPKMVTIVNPEEYDIDDLKKSEKKKNKKDKKKKKKDKKKKKK